MPYVTCTKAIDDMPQYPSGALIAFVPGQPQYIHESVRHFYGGNPDFTVSDDNPELSESVQITPAGLRKGGAALTAGEMQAVRAGIAGASATAAKTLLPASPMAVSMLANGPIAATGEAITFVLGPTAQANATSEYITLKTAKTEIAFDSAPNLALNIKKINAAGGWPVFSSGQSLTNIASSPRIGDPGLWWNRGGVALVTDSDEITFSYVLNTTNSAKVFVDGKSLPGATAAGVVSNAVTSTSNARQWVTITLPSRVRRLVCIYVAGLKSIVIPTYASLSAPDFRGRAIVFGDSFAGRTNGTGEAPTLAVPLAASTLQALGWDAVNATDGGTGFVNNGGGGAKGSYNDYIDYFRNNGPTSGFDLSAIGLVWLYGTGNDSPGITTSAQYRSVIENALATFPNATVVVSTVYDGFNTPAVVSALNPLMAAAVAGINSSRVVFFRVDAEGRSDGFGLWSGTGSLAAPAGNGNADIYFSNASQGAGDRHPNVVGVLHGANWQAYELGRLLGY